MRRNILGLIVMTLSLGFSAYAQQQQPETRVSLSETATASDALGNPALEATLRTSSINGAIDTPVTNVRMLIKNVSPAFYAYVSGVVTFYDGSGVRCGEGMFKADVLAPGESVEVDAPGLRVTCSAATWRIVATNLAPRILQGLPTATGTVSPTANLIISVDGEDHPLQLNRPMVLTLGETRRTIVVRQTP
jgi:hypothetical protein